MIQFNYTGDPFPTFEQQLKSKNDFIDKLGDFKDEFEQKGGIVTFNYSVPPEDDRRIAFVLSAEHDLFDFIRRWNDYIISRK